VSDERQAFEQREQAKRGKEESKKEKVKKRGKGGE
jgi:hypothetical protein